MVNKVSLLVLLILNSNFLFSINPSLIFIDIETKLPINNLKINVLNKDNIYISDSNGHLEHNLKPNDTFITEHINYISKTIVFENSIDTIFLKNKVNRLPNIVIRSFKKVREFGILDCSKMGEFHFYNSLKFYRKIDVSDIKGLYKIKSIVIPLGFDKKFDKDSNRCIVQLYKGDEITEKPSEELLLNPIILDKNSNYKKFKIDVLDQNLILNEKLLYIGLECFIKNGRSFEKSILMNNDEKPKIERSPIEFYFKGREAFNDLDNGITIGKYLEIRKDLKFKNKWHPVFFPSGLEILTYE